MHIGVRSVILVLLACRAMWMGNSSNALSFAIGDELLVINLDAVPIFGTA